MNDNFQEIPILVTYFTNSKILCQKEFGSFAHFGSVLNYFDRNIKKQGITKLKKKYMCKNKEINDNDLLINIIQSSYKNKKIAAADLSIEIEEEEKMYLLDKNIPLYTIILQPKYNPFGIYILSLKNFSLTLKTFPKKFGDENELNKLNENSAYCNSPKNLFISGGIYNKNNLTNFWIINNENFNIIKLYMGYPKSNHSMKYINHDNNEIIFIVGGEDLKTFYYDIKSNKFVNWGNMNYNHYRPALIYINNYLYCFDASQKSGIIFERTNLNDKSHKWEKIVPNLENEKIDEFTNTGFSANLCGGGKIMFCGGDIINLNIYLYDINKNLIYLNTQCTDILFTFSDKNFYKINNNHNIALPNSLEENKTILFADINNYSLKKIILNNKNINNKFNNNNYKNEQEISIGKVFIKVKEENIKKEKNINKKENKDEKFDDGKANNISYFESKKEEKKNILENEKSKENVKIKKEEYLYMPNNDNFQNYKKEKPNLNFNNNYYKNNFKNIKKKYDDKGEIYEAEGNNIICDSIINKFNGIKINNDITIAKHSKKNNDKNIQDKNSKEAINKNYLNNKSKK